MWQSYKSRYSLETRRFHAISVVIALLFSVFWLYANLTSRGAGLAGGAVAGGIMLFILPIAAANGLFGFYALHRSWKRKEPLLLTIIIATPFWWILYFFLHAMI